MADQGMKSVQRSNFTDTFQLFYKHQQLTKQTIIDELALSRPTATANLQKLIDRNLIIEAGQSSNEGRGRKAIAYSLNPTAFVALGVELFSDHVTLVAVGANEKTLYHTTFKLPFANKTSYYLAVTSAIQSFTKQHHLNAKQIIGLGLGLQGLVSADGTEVIYGKILNFTGLTTEIFAQYLPYPVTFFHDADAVAIAEQHLSQQKEDAIYLSIGEHLGTAMIVGGQIYHGSNGRSGTMEHISIDPEHGRLCYCGRRGCIETYVSGSALLHGRTDTITEFFERLHSQDQAVQLRWQSYLDHTAHAINNLHMFADSPIILAGEVARYMDQATITALHERLTELSAFPEPKPYLQLGQAGQHPVAVGAALPLLEAHIAHI